MTSVHGQDEALCPGLCLIEIGVARVRVVDHAPGHVMNDDHVNIADPQDAVVQGDRHIVAGMIVAGATCVDRFSPNMEMATARWSRPVDVFCGHRRVVGGPVLRQNEGRVGSRVGHRQRTDIVPS